MAPRASSRRERRQPRPTFALVAAALLVLVGLAGAVTGSPAVSPAVALGMVSELEPDLGGESYGVTTVSVEDASAPVLRVRVVLVFTAERAFSEIVLRTGTDDAIAGVATITATATSHLGNVRLVTKTSQDGQNGNPVATLAYKPFGLAVVVSGSEPTYKYTGEYREAAANLFYLHSRWYDPTIGRFLSPDDLCRRGSPWMGRLAEAS